MKDLLISIVTPTLNQAETLAETIESVRRQSYPHVEHLIYDGGSTDDTLAILHRYDGTPGLRWISEPDRGQSHAINKGLAACRGEIFNWLNSDDLLEKNALGKIAEAFSRHPDAEIVSGYTDEFRWDPAHPFNRTQLQIRGSAEETITVGVYCQPSTFWRTRVVRDLGGVREDLHYCMDCDLWMRHLLGSGQNRVLKLDALLAFYRHHKKSKTKRHPDRFYAEGRLLFDELNRRVQAPESFLEDPGALALQPGSNLPLPAGFDPERYLGKYCERRVRIARTSNKAEARTWLWRAFRYRPWVTPWRLKLAVRLLGDWLAATPQETLASARNFYLKWRLARAAVRNPARVPRR